MAFNPLSNFQKYPQFWMASILLLTMVTFVLCSGTKGDFGDRLSRLFGGGRGSKVFSIGGSNYSDVELSEIRNQRKLASIYMLKASEICRRSVMGRLENLEAAPPAANAGQQAQAQFFEQVRLFNYVTHVLGNRAKKVHYFDIGTNPLDDMVDFLVTLKEADRLGIDLTDQDLRLLVDLDLFVNVAEFSKYDSSMVFQQARSQAGLERAGEGILTQAL